MIAILAVDPGAKSGAALYIGDTLVASWQVKPGGEWAVIAEAISLADGAAIICVREDWSLGGRQQTHKRADGSSYQHTNINMLAGLGRAFGRWEGALHHEGIKRVVKVFARTWQSRMVSGVVLKRDEMIVATRRVAHAIAGRDCGDDESVAVVLGKYATTYGLRHVHAMLTIAEGKRLGIDVPRAREIVAAEKAQKRATKAAKRPRKARTA